MTVRTYVKEYGREVYFDNETELLDYIKNNEVKAAVKNDLKDIYLTRAKEYYLKERSNGEIMQVVRVSWNEVQHIIYPGR